MASPKVQLPSLEVVRAARAIKESKLKLYYPDDGPFARSKYPKHMEVVRATKTYNEVAFLSGNRTGKTDLACYCLAVWLSGRMPPWWHGRVFDGPIKAWACGDTSKTTRDILQEKLLGSPAAPGTGFILPYDIYYKTPKIGTPDAVETLYVKHVSGGISELGFRSYDQRREAFQGTTQHVIVDDEEPPEDIYQEQMMRLVTSNGLMLLTMTPLMGLTNLVTQYMAESPAGSI